MATFNVIRVKQNFTNRFFQCDDKIKQLYDIAFIKLKHE